VGPGGAGVPGGCPDPVRRGGDPDPGTSGGWPRSASPAGGRRRCRWSRWMSAISGSRQLSRG
jgi:hypothetical protein